MQPFQYDLRCSAAKHTSTTHAAVAPRNLNAAMTILHGKTQGFVPNEYETSGRWGHVQFTAELAYLASSKRGGVGVPYSFDV